MAIAPFDLNGEEAYRFPRHSLYRHETAECTRPYHWCHITSKAMNVRSRKPIKWKWALGPGINTGRHCREAQNWNYKYLDSFSIFNPENAKGQSAVIHVNRLKVRSAVTGILPWPFVDQAAPSRRTAIDEIERSWRGSANFPSNLKWPRRMSPFQMTSDVLKRHQCSSNTHGRPIARHRFFLRRHIRPGIVSIG